MIFLCRDRLLDTKIVDQIASLPIAVKPLNPPSSPQRTCNWLSSSAMLSLPPQSPPALVTISRRLTYRSASRANSYCFSAPVLCYSFSYNISNASPFRTVIERQGALFNGSGICAQMNSGASEEGKPVSYLLLVQAHLELEFIAVKSSLSIKCYRLILTTTSRSCPLMRVKVIASAFFSWWRGFLFI